MTDECTCPACQDNRKQFDRRFTVVSTPPKLPEGYRRAPLYVMMLLHYHCVAEPFPNDHAPAQRKFKSQLFASGLIRELFTYGPGVYETTDKGKALVEHILRAASKLPEQETTWRIPT